jgi:carbon monoxide dehydrogenase subunit G
VKFHEEFDIKQPPEEVWDFFEKVDEVARCLPGVESVTVHDADNLEVKITQSVGPMSATFTAKVKIIERDAGRRIAFTAIGKTVRGASGNIRATNTVSLEPLDGVGTRVRVDADVALAGVLGSVGQKVIARQATKVAGQFATNLQQVVTGEPQAAAPVSATSNRAASNRAASNRAASNGAASNGVSHAGTATRAAVTAPASPVSPDAFGRPEPAGPTGPLGKAMASLNRPPTRLELLLAALAVALLGYRKGRSGR